MFKCDGGIGVPLYNGTLLIRPPLVHSNVLFKGQHNDASR